MFPGKLQVSRERLEFYYSIAVMIAIPVLIVANTLIIINAVQKDYNTELRQKADLVNGVIASSIVRDLDSPETLQAYVETISQENAELTDIHISQPSPSSQFMMLATTDKARAGRPFTDIQSSLAANKQQSIAQLITTASGERKWSVIRPVVVDDKVVAVVSSAASLKEADALIANTLLQSLGIVGFTVVLSILLLLNHFKFVEYAMLFRKLKEVDQLKNDFLSVATHELRAPMTVIKGTIENLEDGIGGKVDKQAKATLDGMFNETERLNSLVTDLLNVSRIEQGKISYDMTDFDAREVIGQIVTQFTPRAAEKGLQLSYERPEQPVTVHVDRGRLVEIMTNLVDNAIKYSRTGTVVVSHKPADGTTRISVRDTGLGMSATERERLFKRFYRVQNDNTKGIPGTGLGLWIIKQYIESMHGSISVDSLEGVGTEFIVEFPVMVAAVAETTEPSDPEHCGQRL